MKHSTNSPRPSRLSTVFGAAAVVTLLWIMSPGSALYARVGRSNIVYVLNNNSAAGQNAVIGFSRNPDGSLIDLPGSPFFTGGTGYRNTNERIGPDDTDQELILSPDKRFLFAVNTGSDNISAFRVRLDGSLRLVDGSPFPSGGKQPSSLALAGGFLYVANRGDGILPTMAAPAYTAGTPGATNYSVLQVLADGSLKRVPDATVNAPDGSSPSQVHVSPDGQFLFADNFLSPSADPPFAPIFPFAHSLLLSFTLDEDDGSMEAQPALSLPHLSQFVISNVFRPFILGLKAHPTQRILYAGVVTAGVLGVWSWDDSGALTYVRSVDPGNIGGAGGLCWLAIDPAAKWLYTASVGPDSIGVFSLADPMSPVLLQNFVLGGPKAALPAGTPEPYNFTTAPFNLAVDPSGKYLYVVTHATCTSDTIDPACTSGNAIHILQIGADGKLSETTGSPMIFSPSVVPNNTHPKGLVVL